MLVNNAKQADEMVNKSNRISWSKIPRKLEKQLRISFDDSDILYLDASVYKTGKTSL
jgi:hypothetical protein